MSWQKCGINCIIYDIIPFFQMERLKRKREEQAGFVVCEQGPLAKKVTFLLLLFLWQHCVYIICDSDMIRIILWH